MTAFSLDAFCSSSNCVLHERMLPTKDSRFAALTFTFKMLVAEIRILLPSPTGDCASVSKVSNLNNLERKHLINGIISTGLDHD